MELLLQGIGILFMATAMVCAGLTFVYSGLRSPGSGAGKGIRPMAFVMVGGLGLGSLVLFWAGRSL
jgi:hypothetical protein